MSARRSTARRPEGARSLAAAATGRPLRLQRSLAVGRVNDPLEHEADRVAHDALRTPSPSRCACGGTPGPGGECAACRAKRLGLQRSPSARAAPATAPPVVHEALAASGRPLEPRTRAFFEPRLGLDLAQVRVHDDALAAHSAAAVQASAYTVGSDIAFGEGRYTPGTSEGDRLLAHELAHVAQQEGATRLRRQPAPPPVSTAAPAAVTWSSCAVLGRDTAMLDVDLATAMDWVRRALADIDADERPAKTTAALARYLTTTPRRVDRIIRPILDTLLFNLERGAGNFRCQTEEECLATAGVPAVAYAGNPITLCPPYFDKTPFERATTLVHEAGHNAGLHGNVIEWEWPFAGLSEDERIENTESYAAFVRTNAMPALAPFELSAGVQVGFGTLTGAEGAGPGAASSEPPRYIVSVEIESLTKRRIFHFMDLHVGTRFDYASDTTMIGSMSIGPRMFAPVQVEIAPGTPLFLDLRAGVAVGITPVLQDVPSIYVEYEPVVGPVVGVGVGTLVGNFGIGVDYRRIISLMESVPDLNELVVAGEVRF